MSLAREPSVHQLLSSDDEIIAPVCGTRVWWDLRDSCEAAVAEHLIDPSKPIEMHVLRGEEELVSAYIRQTLRQRVLEQCKGNA